MENLSQDTTVTTATVATGAKVETPQTPSQTPVQSAPQPAQQSAPTVAPPDKAARFKNRAEDQVSRIMAEIKRIKKLANRKYYDYTPELIDELFEAIQKEIEEAKTSFTTGTIEKKKLFTFSK